MAERFAGRPRPDARSRTEAREVLNTILFPQSQDVRQITAPSLDVDGSNGLEGGGFSPVAERTARRR